MFSDIMITLPILMWCIVFYKCNKRNPKWMKLKKNISNLFESDLDLGVGNVKLRDAL